VPTITIVTDTDSSLPKDLAGRHGIIQVPINVHFGQETLRTGVDIDDSGLFERVKIDGRLPTTSSPSPGQFIEAFAKAFESGAAAVVCLCVSSEVSASYNAALAARDMLPDKDITVVDTRTLTMAQGFMALAAAQLAEAGASPTEIVHGAIAIGDRSHVFAALATLKYLAMSGRVGHLAAGMASLLDVKPVLTVKDGKLQMLERVRTRARAWQRIVELTKAVAATQPIDRLAIFHASASEQVPKFEAQLRASMECPDDIVVAEFTPGLSVHGGAGMVGIVSITVG